MTLKGIDYAVLEYLAFWEENLTANRLSELFGVDRAHAQRAIVTPYQRENPGRLEGRGRARRLADLITPIFGPKDVREMFALVDAVRTVFRTDRVGVRSVEVDAIVPRSGDGGLRPLYAAGSRREAALVTFDGPDGPETGRFSPHHLVRCAFGAHFRGHLSPSGGGAGRYLDLDPHRILRVEGADPGAFVGDEGDVDWHASETVTFRLAEGLSPSVRAAALREYAGHEGVEAGLLVLRRVRRCLVPHLVRQVRFKILDEGPVEVWVPDTRPESACEKHVFHCFQTLYMGFAC